MPIFRQLLITPVLWIGVFFKPDPNSIQIHKFSKISDPDYGTWSGSRVSDPDPQQKKEEKL